MLKVKKLGPAAKLPTVAHTGDLAYDLYALEDTVLKFGVVTKVRTGIAAQAFNKPQDIPQAVGYSPLEPLGLLIRDRSSMASKGIVVSGGVLDSGYTGEISVLMTNSGEENDYSYGYTISAGDKIAQMIPLPVLTGEVVEIEELGESSRGANGFGSSGK